MNSLTSYRTSSVSSEELLLRAACLSVFLGRAWQHWFWDAPWRALFWDEDLMQGLVTLLTPLSWQEYTTHPDTDWFIHLWVRGFGVFYLLCAAAAVIVNQRRKWAGYLLLTGGVALFLLALLYWKEQFFRGGQLIEYASQFGGPLLLYGVVFRSLGREQLLLMLKIVVALTFLGHGLYALGFYPVPGHFVEMTMRILGIGETEARLFLRIAGGLDMVVAVGIFMPGAVRWCLLYAAAWGLATALARPWAGFHPALPWAALHQSVFEAIYRLPHALLPLAAWWLTRNPSVRSFHSELEGTINSKQI